MKATKPQGPAIHWPVPAFFELANNSLQGRDRNCIVQFSDLGTASGTLLEFDTDNCAILIQPPDSWNSQRIELKDIHTIRMLRPLELKADVTVMKRVLQTPERQSFRAIYRTGEEFVGDTLGFVQEQVGWFLFLLEDGGIFPIECFIPAQAIVKLEFGLHAGDSSPSATVQYASPSGEKLDELRRKRPVRPVIKSVGELQNALIQQQQKPLQRLGEVLVESGTLTKVQLQSALTVQAENRGRNLGGILVDLGLISQATLHEALTDKLGIPKVSVQDFAIAPDALALIDEDFATRNQVLPLYRTNSSLIIAIETPSNSELTSSLRFSTGLSITPVLADPAELKLRIAKEYRDHKSFAINFESESKRSSTELSDLTFQLSQEVSIASNQPAEPEPGEFIADSALVKLMNKIIQDAHWQNASDIHIESNPGKSSTRIRFRIDGVLTDYVELSSAYRSALISRIKVMAGINISERRLAQDGKIDFAGQGGGLPIELRVATIPTANNLEDAVVRILSRAEPIPIDKLSLSEHNLDELKKMVRRSHGLILVCGPTGSGKTTTLHALLGHINRPDIKIWTAEDPIEITQPGLRQVQVHNKIGWTFAAVMQAFLRADPDVIMMGEIRASDAAKICIEASLTGHLVFSTLHTNSAPESVTRLLDFGMDPFNFADALVGILSQRLARKLCNKCKRSYIADDEEIADLAEEYCAGTRLKPAAVIENWIQRHGDQGRITLYAPVGCDACIGGYKGRIGVHELLTVTPHIKKLIISRASAAEIAEVGMESGMVSLRQDGIDKVLLGTLDLGSAHHSLN